MTRIEQLESLNLESLPAEIPELQQIYGSTVKELISAYRQIEYLNNRIYGKRSEQFQDDRQLRLGLLGEEQSTTPPETEEKETISYERKKRKGRKFDNLPEITEDKYPEESELICACCGEQKEEAFTEETTQLHYKPCELSKRKTIKHVFKCKSGCEAGLTRPKPEPHIIPNCLATPELLAHVLTAKFVDHLPLHRIGNIFQRHGLELSDNTLISWVNQFGSSITTVVSCIKKQLLESKLVGTDDTTIRVLACESGKNSKTEWEGSATGRFWQYQSLEGQICFEYTPTRGAAGPSKFLKDYQGYVQADDYAGYNDVYRGGAVQVGCWAHGRRNFFELPEKHKYRAESLRFIGELYRVERQIKTVKKENPDLPDEQVVQMRQSLALPMLESFKSWLKGKVATVLPKSDFYQAAQYILTNEHALSRYLEVGFLSIDNNWVERKIRPIAIGRKNWLFCGNNDTAQNAARILTLAANCSAAQVNPYDYFVYLIKEYSRASSKDIFKLTPWGYKKFLAEKKISAAA